MKPAASRLNGQGGAEADLELGFLHVKAPQACRKSISPSTLFRIDRAVRIAIAENERRTGRYGGDGYVGSPADQLIAFPSCLPTVN
jgi:hypothetical protein